MKRRATKLLLFLLLGAVLNVAIIVTIVLTVRRPTPGPALEQASLTVTTSGRRRVRWFLSTWREPTKLVVSSHRHRLSEGEIAQPDFGTMRLPGWGHGLKNPSVEFADGRTDFEQVVLVGQGWPCIALWQEHYRREEKPSRQAWSVRGAIDFGDSWSNPDVLPRMIPYRLAWPGFAINTIFYAAILWLPFAAFGRIRRRRRIKRGLCPACAYPLGTNPRCTECGKPVG